ncbi:spore coat protein U domain-containing protein [Pantoea rodasii]|uniref:spore coat protein U domain-containing protein n=1 Tax=Pantoea rodasii TaxID=1076549 RepID=UPI001301EA3D|nr:spore coat protein U domain-containing protein [Pantoea rodasii]
MKKFVKTKRNETMIVNQNIKSAVSAAVALTILPFHVFADPASTTTLTATIPVTMTVSPGCAIFSSSNSEIANAGEALSLNFSGSNFTQKAQGSFTVKCTNGTDPAVSLTDNKDSWSMQNGKTIVPYTISSDEAGKNIIAPGGQLTLDNGIVSLFASATVPQNAATGTYKDDLTATISW